jgi:hypothetical protein
MYIYTLFKNLSLLGLFTFKPQQIFLDTSSFFVNIYFFCHSANCLYILNKMTKLTEWLTGLAVFFGIYWILVTKKVSNQFTEDFYFHIQISPVIIVLLLGVRFNLIIIKLSIITNFI